MYWLTSFPRDLIDAPFTLGRNLGIGTSITVIAKDRSKRWGFLVLPAAGYLFARTIPARLTDGFFLQQALGVVAAAGGILVGIAANEVIGAIVSPIQILAFRYPYDRDLFPTYRKPVTDGAFWTPNDREAYVRRATSATIFPHYMFGVKGLSWEFGASRLKLVP